MNSKALKNLLNTIFICIPVLLILLSLYLWGSNGPGYTKSIQVVWKTYWHAAYYFFLLSFFGNLILFLMSSEKSIKGFISAYKFWLIGLLLSMFSFAIAGILVDISYTIRYLIFHQ